MLPPCSFCARSSLTLALFSSVCPEHRLACERSLLRYCAVDRDRYVHTRSYNVMYERQREEREKRIVFLTVSSLSLSLSYTDCPPNFIGHNCTFPLIQLNTLQTVKTEEEVRAAVSYLSFLGSADQYHCCYWSVLCVLVCCAVFGWRSCQ